VTRLHESSQNHFIYFASDEKGKHDSILQGEDR
jgi:hypothetical protein